MLLRPTRRRFLFCGINSVLTGLLAGCGTVLHPERRGQPAGPLDWKIVGLNTLGLLFFFVPGVIAFAVDFNNGTIYLPPNDYGTAHPQHGNMQLTPVSMPKERISQAQIGQIVSQHTGRTVDLTTGHYETHRLESIDEFWPMQRKRAAS